MNYILAKAASGRLVRVPEDKFEEWQEAQDELRNGKKAEVPEDFVERFKAAMNRYIETPPEKK